MGMLRAMLLAECVLVLVLIVPALPPVSAGLRWESVGDPAHPGTCFIKEKGFRVKSGYRWNLPGCTSATCYGTGTDMTIEYRSCASMSVSPNCRIFQDMTKPHPDCCGDVYCKF